MGTNGITAKNYQSILDQVSQELSAYDNSNAEDKFNTLKAGLTSLFEGGIMNGGKDGAASIQRQIQAYDDAIKDLEADAKRTAEDIERQEQTINTQAEEIGNTATDLNAATGKLQKRTKEIAGIAALEAVAAYKNSNRKISYENCFQTAFSRHLGDLGADKAEVRRIWDNFTGRQSKLQPLYNAIETSIAKLEGYQNKIKGINALKGKLENARDIMSRSHNDHAINNADLDTKAPILTGKKLELANQLASNYREYTNASSGVSTQSTVDKSYADKVTDFKASANYNDKFKLTDNYKATTSTGNDTCSQNNPQLVELNRQIGEGLLTELQNSGFSNDEVLQYIHDNFNVYISKNDDGSWNIPWGHPTNPAIAGFDGGHTSGMTYSNGYTLAADTYQRIREVANSGATARTENDVNSKQKQGLSDAINRDDILTQMHNQKFTFKEAMYVLTRLFPDAGIQYQPGQNDGNGHATYGMVTPSSNNADNLYTKIATQIQNYWGVGSTELRTEAEPVSNRSVDPFTIYDSEHNITYTLTIDRDKNGQFDYTSAENNEVLGTQDDDYELLQRAIQEGGGKLNAEVANKYGIAFMVRQETHNNDGSTGFSISYRAFEGNDELDFSANADGKGGLSTKGAGEDGIYDDKIDEGYARMDGSTLVGTFTGKIGNSTFTNGEQSFDTIETMDAIFKTVANDNNTNKMSIDIGLEDSDFNQGSAAIDGYIGRINAVKGRLDAISGSDDFNNAAGGWTQEAIDEITGDDNFRGAVADAMTRSERYKTDEDRARDEARYGVDDYYRRHGGADANYEYDSGYTPNDDDDDDDSDE